MVLRACGALMLVCSNRKILLNPCGHQLWLGSSGGWFYILLIPSGCPGTGCAVVWKDEEESKRGGVCRILDLMGVRGGVNGGEGLLSEDFSVIAL